MAHYFILSMKILLPLSFLITSLWASCACGQATNFRDGYQKANPAGPEFELTFSEKVTLHENFLNQATQAGDPLQRLYGFLYLFNDYLLIGDYPQATQYLQEAERIASASRNPGWQGWVVHRKGILSVFLKDYRGAIPYYEAAAALCGQARDSLCLGESLEQLCSMHDQPEEFEQAQYYFNLALPLIEKYGGKIQVATSLNNFAILLVTQKRFEEAISYYERALVNVREVGDKRRQAIYMSNLASVYRQTGRYEEALAQFQLCASINQENNWPDNLISNYSGLAETYEDLGNFRQALDFLYQYDVLHDSLVGAETLRQIADLEIKYQGQEKELALQKSEVALLSAQRRLAYGAVFIFFGLLLAAFGWWRWRWQLRQTRREQQQNQETLSDLTRILSDKNVKLTALYKQIAQFHSTVEPPPGSANFGKNIYDQRILTDADWAAFKVYFEKVYPGYLSRLRSIYPTMTEAEERLFLFIKLNLTNKETSAILGISAASVKKTRNRLRKRLGLGKEIALDTFVQEF